MEFLSQDVGSAAQRSPAHATDSAAFACESERFVPALVRLCRETGVRSASLFLREACRSAAGFVRVAAVATEAEAAPAPLAPPPRLPADAFLLRRLRRLSGPLCIEPDDLRAWERAVEANAVPGDDAAVESRRAEVDLLRASRASLAALVSFAGEPLGILLLGPRAAAASANGTSFSSPAPDRSAESRALAAACRELALLAKSGGLS